MRVVNGSVKACKIIPVCACFNTEAKRSFKKLAKQTAPDFRKFGTELNTMEKSCRKQYQKIRTFWNKIPLQ